MVDSPTLKGVVIGAGYFSDFHLDAWNRIAGVEIVAICDLDRDKAEAAAKKHHVETVLTDPAEAMGCPEITFVDIATPPASHLELVPLAIQHRLAIICQKPVAPTAAEAKTIFDLVHRYEQPFMVHENFRFQPWYREIRRLIDTGAIGSKLHTISMRTRMGDGWGEDAYLARQPYFREMPRLLVHETGVHFVDTFRFLAGEIDSVHATLRRWNSAIAGEDAGLITFRFQSGAVGLWDANRYNESLADDPRYTFGNLCVEGDRGSIWLDESGQITVKPLGEPAVTHGYDHTKVGFAGDCVRAAQSHFVDVIRGRCQCETSAGEYAKTLSVVEQIYDSAQPTRNIIDLSLTIDETLPKADVDPLKSIAKDGWRATTLRLYSHCGTHMDATCHFLTDGETIDRLNLQACCGTARVVNLAPAQPRQLITVEDFTAAVGEELRPGERLLFRTDWYRRYPSPQYRDELPRISLQLAQFLVDKQVRLIGVEPPSVADVGNIQEVTEVHQTLFRGGIVIVEGLTNLDKIDAPFCQFIALPLKIAAGDGCPVRAIAMTGGSEPDPLQAFGFQRS